MEYTAIAQWLNTAFAGFDGAILGFMNSLAGSAGGILTPLAKAITFLGEKGILMLVLALILMCFSKTRRAGVCVFGAVCCGALITNIILKDWVARPRPFEYMAQYKVYWEAVGSPAEDGFSFPSGHVTAAAAGMAALCFTRGKKFILPSALVVFLMCFSRNYLMAHFPSDVLFATVIGLLSAYVAYLITKAIFNYLEDNDDFPACASILNFDLPLPKLAFAEGWAGRGRRAARTGRVNGGDSEDGEDIDGAEEVRRAEKKPRSAGGSHAAAGGESKSISWRAALQGAADATGKLTGRKGKDRTEGEEKPKARGGKSDWNSRWESYRSARDEKAKLAAEPDVKEWRAADKESAGADAPHAENDDAAAQKNTAAADDATVRIDKVSDSVKNTPRPGTAAADDTAETAIVENTADVSLDDVDWARLGLSFPEDGDGLSGTEVELDEPRKSRRDIQRAARGGAYRGRHEK